MYAPCHGYKRACVYVCLRNNQKLFYMQMLRTAVSIRVRMMWRSEKVRIEVQDKHENI